MTQPAKSQEPSMEEILASIRRIIADDPVRSPRPEIAPPGALHTDKAKTNDALYRDRAPLSERRDDLPRPLPPRDDASSSLPRAFSSRRAEEADASAQPPSRSTSFVPGARPQPPILPPRAQQPSAASPAPVSPQQEIDAMLAELNSRSRAASCEPEMPAADILELTEEASAEETPADVVSPAAELLENVEAAEEMAPASPLHVDSRDQELAYEEEEAAPERVPPQFHVAEGATEPLPNHHQPIAGSGMDERLISAATTAAVDSAFNTLAETVLVQNARTLEELVREMLRPMLKIWLDDNLPGLVERLVRAEIERVSRGRG